MSKIEEIIKKECWVGRTISKNFRAQLLDLVKSQVETLPPEKSKSKK